MPSNNSRNTKISLYPWHQGIASQLPRNWQSWGGNPVLGADGCDSHGCSANSVEGAVDGADVGHKIASDVDEVTCEQMPWQSKWLRIETRSGRLRTLPRLSHARKLDAASRALPPSRPLSQALNQFIGPPLRPS
jgi:hypothetical protein